MAESWWRSPGVDYVETGAHLPGPTTLSVVRGPVNEFQTAIEAKCVCGDGWRFYPQVDGQRVATWLAQHADHTAADSLDGLMKTALLAMLHDTSGLSGTVDHVKRSADTLRADGERLDHLEGCAEASVVGGPVTEQDATSTGSGIGVVYATIGCPHGEPLRVQTSAYGTVDSLLSKMIELGKRSRAEQEGDDDTSPRSGTRQTPDKPVKL